MGTLPISSLHDMAEELADTAERNGVTVTRYLHISKEMAASSGAQRLTSMYFCCDEYITLFRVIQNSSPPPGSWIRFAGAGVTDLSPTNDILQLLLRKGPSYAWGGPFIAAAPSDRILFGTSYTIPGDLVRDSTDSFQASAAFIYQMIGMVGRVARILSNDVLPAHGGRLLGNGDDDRTTFNLAVTLH